MNAPSQWQALALISSVALVALAVLCIPTEALLTEPDQRPSRWSGASIALLFAALACLTIAISPYLLELWRVAFP